MRRVQNLLYPELSYKIVGLLMEIHNKLGNKYQEKHYQRAFEIKLDQSGMKFKREFLINLRFEGETMGKFYVDFLVEDKIIVELKKVWKMTQNDYKQVLRYLDSTGFKLAILVNLRHQRLEFRRVVNSRPRKTWQKNISDIRGKLARISDDEV